MRNVYGIGETVLDIIFKNEQVIAAKAGGSVLNSMVSLGRTGVNPFFISELGNDQVGSNIISFLNRNNINTSFLNLFDDGKSPLALAFLNEKNDASYSFYKMYPKKRLTISLPDFKKNDIVLFGSFYGIDKNVRTMVLKLIQKAKKANTIVIYDPNFRKSHLHELRELKPIILENMEFADLVRASDEDLLNIFKTSSADDSYSKIKKYNKNLILTANQQGVTVCTPNFIKKYPVKKITPISTIGAGDNFNAGIIYSLIQKNITLNQLNKISEDEWNDIINTAINFATNVCLSLDNYISEEFAHSLKNKIE